MYRLIISNYEEKHKVCSGAVVAVIIFVAVAFLTIAINEV